MLSFFLQIQRSVLMRDAAVDLMKENRISKVKLFDADPTVLRGLAGSHIPGLVETPNDMLGVLGSSSAAADLWLKGTLLSGAISVVLLPAVLNLQQSLTKADLAMPMQHQVQIFSAARAFNRDLISCVLSNRGTPLRPRVHPMDVCLS